MPANDRRRDAGEAAERQMEFYLHRAFGHDVQVQVINDLRIVDPEQPNPDGSPGVAQIDHLVLHRHGVIIVESKSVHDTVSVRDDGHGRDEWTRRYRGRDSGFPSPIRQAMRQGAFLRAVLQAHRSQLLGLMPAGMRTLSKVIHGSDQRSFAKMPVQVVVAISDGGKINRNKGWNPPSEPFQTYVVKADLVPETISDEIKRHCSGGSLLGASDGAYGTWSMEKNELEPVAAFLRDRHTPREQPRRVVEVVSPAPTPPPPPAPAPTPTAPGTAACKSCGGRDLEGRWGKYGYYWSCRACETNTTMPLACGACGHDGRRDKTVRVRKAGPTFTRECQACGMDERIWTNTDG